MRTHRMIFGLVVLGGVALHDAWGADEATPANVRIDLQMVSVSMADSLTLIPALRDAKTASTGWDRLQEMLANGQATLIDWPILWVRNAMVEKRDGPLGAGGLEMPPFMGSRSTSKNVEECRYPSDFGPPLGPQTVIIPPIGPEEPIRPEWEGSLIPTAFETRDTGPTLELDASIEAEGRVVSVNLAAEYARLFGFRKWQKQASPIGIVGSVSTPEFVSSRVRNLLHVIHDRPTLVNVAVVPKPEPHVELSILRARVMLFPREAATPPLVEFDRNAASAAQFSNEPAGAPTK